MRIFNLKNAIKYFEMMRTRKRINNMNSQIDSAIEYLKKIEFKFVDIIFYSIRSEIRISHYSLCKKFYINLRFEENGMSYYNFNTLIHDSLEINAIKILSF